MLYIIRGLPGAGKSTLARALVECGTASAYYEADMFFTDANGGYHLNPNLIGAAHAWCRRKVFEGLANGENIVVSNTFTRLCEMQDYISYCQSYGIPFKVVRLNSQYGSIHNVPESAIKRMRTRFEDYNGEVVITSGKA